MRIEKALVQQSAAEGGGGGELPAQVQAAIDRVRTEADAERIAAVAQVVDATSTQLANTPSNAPSDLNDDALEVQFLHRLSAA